MKDSILITLDLLKTLKDEGYKSLLKTWGEDIYIPKQEKVEELAEFISIVPLHEDTLLSISDAIIYYNNLDLEGSRISNIFESI